MKPLPPNPVIDTPGHPLEPLPPEAAELEADRLVAWDEPVGSTGHRVPRVGMEDEESAVMKLVEQGVDAADDALRERE